MRNIKGYMVLVIMVVTGVILLGFSFLILKRRTNMPVAPAADNSQTSNPAPLVWTDFANLNYGVTLKYPENIFVTREVKAKTVGAITQVFSANSPAGTVTVSIVNRQIDPNNILDPLNGPISTFTTINVANRIGYQYTTTVSGCDQKNIQAPNTNQIVLISFESCPSDAQPNLLSNQDLVQQILASIKLTPITATSNNATPDKNVPTKLTPDQGSSLDTLPPSPTPPAPTPSPTAPKPVIKNFTITADDSAATPAEISVPAGTIVEITFNVSAANVYYGGLDFRSSVVNSGTVFSGQSKTISFTANQSFEFTPYWPSSGVKKNYTIRVNVQ